MAVAHQVELAGLGQPLRDLRVVVDRHPPAIQRQLGVLAVQGDVARGRGVLQQQARVAVVVAQHAMHRAGEALADLGQRKGRAEVAAEDQHLGPGRPRLLQRVGQVPDVVMDVGKDCYLHGCLAFISMRWSCYNRTMSVYPPSTPPSPQPRDRTKLWAALVFLLLSVACLAVVAIAFSGGQLPDLGRAEVSWTPPPDQATTPVQLRRPRPPASASLWATPCRTSTRARSTCAKAPASRTSRPTT